MRFADLSRPPRRRGSSLPSGALAVLWLLFAAFCATAHTTARAQSLDTGAPEAAESGVLGEPQLIEADVGAGTELSAITLFHRFDGERRYRSTGMRESGQPGVYAASVPTVGVTARRLEFYIVAEDTDGETLLKGNSFEPLARELLSAQADAASREVAGPETPEASGGNRTRYVYYALGVLAAGVLIAAASGSGSDDDSSPGCGEDGCELTVVAPLP